MAALNYAVDPYGIYHYGRPGDWTKSRPRMRDVERLHQAHAVGAAHADALLLGNSRVVTSLDPRHPALPAGTYNLGFSACDIYECQRYLQHAVHLHKPRLVLFGIDKVMFDAESKPEVDFSEARLSVDAAMQPQPHWRRSDLADTLFSLTAVGDRAGGNIQFTALRAILRLCAAEDIEIILFTNPVHAELLDIEYGDGREFSAWVRQVVAVVAAECTATGRKVPFWSFYGFNAITTERFPDRRQAVSTMENYWEISHYRKAVGDLVLSRMLGRPEARLAALPDFGRMVTPATVESELDRLASERALWKSAAPGTP